MSKRAHKKKLLRDVSAGRSAIPEDRHVSAEIIRCVVERLLRETAAGYCGGRRGLRVRGGPWRAALRVFCDMARDGAAVIREGYHKRLSLEPR